MTIEVAVTRNQVVVSPTTNEVVVQQVVNTVEIGGPAHPQSHAIGGPDHALSGLTIGHVLTATSPTAADFQPPTGGGGAGLHDLLPDITPNQHHTQAHAIGGGDHTGTLAHSALGSVGANDHHNQAHAISGADHSGAISTAQHGAMAGPANAHRWADIDKATSALADITTRPHSALTGIGTDDHHAKAHAIGGADHSGTLAHSALGSIGANDHHNQGHVLGGTGGLGADHSVSGLTAGQVLRASGATAAAFAVLPHSDLGSVGANDHHNQAHAIGGADHSGTLAHSALGSVGVDDHHTRDHALPGTTHTFSGLTAGHVLRASGASAAAFAQLGHGDLGGVGANDHHNQAHALSGADHSGAISDAQHPVIAAGNHHTEYGRKAAAETIGGAWTFSALLTASGHIQMATNGELRDSGGVAAVKLRAAGTVSSPHVEFYDGATGDIFMRLENRIGVGVDPLVNTVLRIGMPTVGTAPTNQLQFVGTKVATGGATMNFVNFGTVHDAAGFANNNMRAFSIVLTPDDSIGGGGFLEATAFRLTHGAFSGAVDSWVWFRLPHPATPAGGTATLWGVFDVGDADDGVGGITDGWVIRVGDRGGVDPAAWGLSVMGAGGAARPFWQTKTTAEMLSASGGLGAFYNVFAANMTIGRNGAPAASALLDLDSTVGALLVPRMTTTQRDALTPSNGMIIYNTTLGLFQGRASGAWVAL
jgi:hypothetical protein